MTPSTAVVESVSEGDTLFLPVFDTTISSSSLTLVFPDRCLRFIRDSVRSKKRVKPSPPREDFISLETMRKWTARLTDHLEKRLSKSSKRSLQVQWTVRIRILVSCETIVPVIPPTITVVREAQLVLGGKNSSLLPEWDILWLFLLLIVCESLSPSSWSRIFRRTPWKGHWFIIISSIPKMTISVRKSLMWSKSFIAPSIQLHISSRRQTHYLFVR